MNGALEHTTYKLLGVSLSDFISANSGIDDWLKLQPGFRSRHISQKPDGTVIDIVFWDTVEDGESVGRRIIAETSDSPVHDMIDGSTVSWNVWPLSHQI